MKTRIFLIIAAILYLILYLTIKPYQRISGTSQSVLAKKSISLEKRYGNAFVNGIFKDNILLNLAYLEGRISRGSDIDWSKVRATSAFSLILEPGEVFAYHDTLLPAYKGKEVVTSNAHFNSSEGFKSDGWLVGDGVCHFASLINWAARDAGLKVEAPVNHNFAVIPEVPASYGVSIYNTPVNPEASAQQNLYITNNRKAEVVLQFMFDGTDLSVAVVESGRPLALIR